MASGCFIMFDLFLVLLSIFLPPVPVWIKAGFCSADSLINIALCCLGYIPGVIHAWYIIAKYPEVIEIDIERQSQPSGYVVHHVYSPVPAEAESSSQPNYGAVPQSNPPEYSETSKK